MAIQSGVRAKLDAFATMIQAFGVYASTLDAFEAADKILRESGILSLMSSATDPGGWRAMKSVTGVGQ